MKHLVRRILPWRGGLPLAAALLLLAAACSDDDTNTPTDAGPGDGQAPVEGGAGDGLTDGVTGDLGPKTVAPKVDPTEILPTEWMLGAWIGSTSADPVKAALEKGTFTYPKAGTDANKITWAARKPTAGGKLGAFPRSSSYNYIAWAVAKVTLTAPAHLMIMTGPSYEVWINGVLRPGDVYGSRTPYISLPAKAGENIVVVRYFVRAGKTGTSVNAYALLQTTSDELYINEKDLTYPEFPVGDTTEVCLGAPVLNLSDIAAHTLVAKVVGNAYFQETTRTYPGVGPRALSQVAFSLKPKAAFTKGGEEVTVKLHLESPALKFAYQREIKLKTVDTSAAYRWTRFSKVDNSCQYAGVRTPSSFDKNKKYALILSLHGAGVEGIGQAKAYGQKDWAYIVAPTNRRRFGFDWEVWGRLDALEALDHAMATFNIDPTKVYLTGHSMGGHGTWHVGVTTPGRFAAIGPSAGWQSFYTYGGSTKPSGAFARSQAHSDTKVYLSNLKRRGVYIIHGGSDTNVPTSEGQTMYKLVQKVTTDVKYHEEPGAGHWWDKDKTTPGADCVDWKPLMDFFKARTLDPLELDFDFITPAPWYSPKHSYVTITSQTDSSKDSRLVSAKTGTTVALTTTNVRSMKLDGAGLKKKGVTALTVDGKAVTLTDGEISWGTHTGKKPGAYGPFNEVMYRPFCLVYDDGASASAAMGQYASYVSSNWSVIGNGHACVLPLSRVKSAGAPAGYNMIYVGAAGADITGATLTGSWDSSKVTVGGSSYTGAIMFLAYPNKDRLGGAIVANTGLEYLLYRIPLFTSRVVLPDYFVYGTTGTKATGFFTADWK